MIFDRILVPLDGSRLAEASLPAAEALARHLGSVLLLVHTVEPEPPATVHGEPHLASVDAANTYLESHRQRLAALGLSAEVHVVPAEQEDVALAIEEQARKLDAGVVAMCAHGRRTLRGRLLGPIAQRVLHGGSAAILLRTAGSSADGPFDIHRVLAPMDFRHDIDTAMDAVRAVSLGFHAAVTLLHAVGQTPEAALRARLLPATSWMVRDLEYERADERLSQIAASLRADGIDADFTIPEQPPDDAIIDTAQHQAAELIVLVTHGEAGIVAWYEHSIGRRLIEEPKLTLLLLRQP